MKVKFTIPGPPVGKGRPRFAMIAGHAKAHTPEQTVIYENLVRTAYQNQHGEKRFPDNAMLDVRVLVYFDIPKSTSKKKAAEMLAHKIRPTKKPDWDNIGKVVCDSLNGIAYRDDAQIVDAMVRKFYSKTPKVVVSIQEAEGACEE